MATNFCCNLINLLDEFGYTNHTGAAAGDW
jgi:hypothetical protein